MSPLRVPNFSPIGARIRVLWRILQSVRKEVEEKNEEKPPDFFLKIFLFSRGNQHPLPPPLALDVEVLDKNWTEIKGSNLNN